jgi:hypothetical protein
VFLERGVRAKFGRDGRRQWARGFAAAIFLHAIPKKRVVPDLEKKKNEAIWAGSWGESKYLVAGSHTQNETEHMT